MIWWVQKIGLGSLAGPARWSLLLTVAAWSSAENLMARAMSAMGASSLPLPCVYAGDPSQPGEQRIARWMCMPLVAAPAQGNRLPAAPEYERNLWSDACRLRPPTLPPHPPLMPIKGPLGESSFAVEADPILRLRPNRELEASSFVLSCDLVSPRQAQFCLITSGRDLYDVFVNGGLVASFYSGGRWTKKYGQYIPVVLTEGMNRLDIVLSTISPACEFTAHVVTLDQAARSAVRNHQDRIVARSVVNVGEALPLAMGMRGLLGAKVECVRYLGKGDGRTLEIWRSDRGYPEPREWRFAQEGAYEMDTSYPEGRNSEAFYVGRIGCLAAQAETKLAAALRDDSGRRFADDGINACARLRVLENKLDDSRCSEVSRREAAYWGRQVVFALQRLNRAGDEHHGAAYSTGLNIASYRSPRDGSKQYYLYYLPKGLANGILGETDAIVLECLVQSKRRPAFLDSYFIDFFDLLETRAATADSSRVALVMPHARNLDRSRAAQEEMLAALQDFKDRLPAPVAGTPLGVFGICSAGSDALMIAARHPGMFARVAAVTPSVDPERDAEVASVQRGEVMLSPLDAVTHLGRTPTLLIHGNLDIHMPISASVDLVKQARRAGIDSIELLSLDGATEEYYEACNSEPIIEAIRFVAGGRR